MKRCCFAVVFVVLTGGCASAQPPVSDQSARQAPAHAPSTQHAAPRTGYSTARGDSPSKPPRLSVGVSDPNTQLILPWFLTDLINAVNDP